MITKDGANLMGLSTDTKPTTGIATNTLFLELDTNTFYYFNGSIWAAVGGANNEYSVVETT